MLAKMQNLSSRFSDSTIASVSSSFSKVSSASSVSSVESLHLPSSPAIPKPPPRTSSITLASTKTYTDRRERKKPAPLRLAPSRSSRHCLSSDDDECYFTCKEIQRDSYQTRCFCGSPVRPHTSASTSTSVEIYCSTECARQDALYALEGRSPSSCPSSAPQSDVDEDEDDFPVTPTNAFAPSPPRTPAAKARSLERPMDASLTRKLTGIGASHYRRMEAMGLYDADVTPSRPSRSSLLLDPIDLTVAHSPSSKSSRLSSSLTETEEVEEPDFDPRKTLFFQVPFYLGSPIEP
ncbi:Short-chain dehydrogenase/reductase [Pseudozyma hubeiensis]|nr:Short-chain dehydrogenase/reductase [Pseudozyma hubeiensis]